MAQPPDAEEVNPSAARESTKPASVQVKCAPLARWTDFVHLAFQFKLLGGAGLLVGYSVLAADGAWWLALGFALGGAAFLATSFGIAAYKPWARYAAAGLILPMLAIAVLPALLFPLDSGKGTRATSAVLIVAILAAVSVYCVYVGWILFSRGSRQHYQASSRTRTAVRRTDFAAPALLFKFLGGAGLLFGCLVPWADGAWRLGLGLLLGGAVFLATGFGLAAYKPWARCAAAVLILLMLAIAAILTLLLVLNCRKGNPVRLLLVIAAFPVIVSASSAYVGWLLFSRAGRQHYQASSRAMTAARSDPNSVTSRLRRRK